MATTSPKRKNRKNKKRKKKNKDRKEVITGDISTLKEGLIKEQMMSADEAMNVINIWSLTQSNRFRLYLFWIENYREHKKIEIQRCEQKYEQLCEQLEEVRFEEEEQVIQRATVVGMTTSGAARYHSVLQRVAPRIVVIEEAAEVMEAHIITSLTQNTKHTILIGDHKQLRPKATVYELAQKYNLEVSLFERMVMNNMDCKRLSIQHRMRPEIAALTKRIYDHEIVDHESVCDFEDISGICNNLFFLDHCQPEHLVGGLQSYANRHEAQVLVALCNYLLLQGYQRGQITILTMYTGQLLLLQEQMPRKTFEGVKVCAVDNFQGEENDIILLSLVRSNSEGRIGFLGESNRICVALSRARKGLYCIGNFNLLKRESKLWKEICDGLNSTQAIAECLPLICKCHKNVTLVKRAADFNPLGGCNKPCETRLPCGHACDKLCHASNHQEGRCRKMCLNRCANEHPCLRECHYPYECPRCLRKMTKKVPKCGHEQQMECSVDPEIYSCRMKCEKILPCGHDCLRKCGQECTSPCKVSCVKLLQCGHQKPLPCYMDPMNYNQCNEECTRFLECGHRCSQKCRQTCQCDTEINIELPCEHTKRVLCREKDYPIQCRERCQRKLDCGHDCPGICYEDCQMKQCNIEVVKDLPCGHQRSVPCYKSPQSVFCVAPCPRRLNCGHRCISVCGRPCDGMQCEELCQTKCERGHPCQKRCHFGSSCDDCMVEVNMEFPACGHIIMRPCFVNLATMRCERKCERIRMCGHPCEQSCGTSCDERPCKVRVTKALSCNHLVSLECHRNHENFICKEIVHVHLPCGHEASLECHLARAGLENVLCQTEVEKELPCNHKMTIPCCKNPGDYTCRRTVDVELPCGHTQSIPCPAVTTGLSTVSCTIKVPRTLPCGHEAILPCHVNPMEHCCQEKLEVILTCGHSQVVICSRMRSEQEPGACDTTVMRMLPCGHEKEVACGDNPEDAYCDSPCGRYLPCGHLCPKNCGDDCSSFKCSVRVKKDLSCGYHNISCLCSDDVSQVTCSYQCKRKLKCGHSCPGKCRYDCTLYKCQKRMVEKLCCKGDHHLKMPCSEDPKNVACHWPCNSKLDCGHRCPGVCGEPCESMKCFHAVDKKYPCGHTERGLPCIESKTATCKLRCQRRKKCKHKCQGVCGEPCSKYPCNVDVCKTFPCGHRIKMPCSYSVDDVHCPAPCGAILPCGHQCSGTCSDCLQGGSHQMCQQPCGRLLVCLHRCKATCCEPCPPCDRKCSRRCPHKSCTRRCSQPCEPCKEPCSWSCPHYQCNNPCGEECDRPRCDAPCTKKLACKHPCIGLCGENCPTLCAVCHAKELSFMLGGRRAKANETKRYLQLFDCGHILAVEEMDAWVMREFRGEVQLIRCPRCSVAITFSFRYGNLIKRTVRVVEKVGQKSEDLAKEVTDFCNGLIRDVRLSRFNVGTLRFPRDVLAAIQKHQRLISCKFTKVQTRNIPFVFTIKNHLLILHQIKKTQLGLQRITLHQNNSEELLEIGQHSGTISQALENILQYLMKPQLDLKTLYQVQQHTRLFFLFGLILEAKFDALKNQARLSSIGETRFKQACDSFNLFLQGNSDALQVDWLERVVALLRGEVSLASLPLEEAKELENFPGFNVGVWKLCEHRQVHFTRRIVRGGEDVSIVSNSCRECMGNDDCEGKRCSSQDG